jgi:hypothetical protein
MVFTNKVLEFGARFATETFLQPSASRLTNGHVGRSIQVRLEGLRAAIHFLAHDDDDDEITK